MASAAFSPPARPQGCDAGDGDGAGEDAAAGGGRGQVVVLARHVFRGTEIPVRLPRRAKFKHVKRALARLLQNDQIVTQGELLRKEGGRYRGFQDRSVIKPPLGHVGIVCRCDLSL